jgi:hypothetical protein
VSKIEISPTISTHGMSSWFSLYGFTRAYLYKDCTSLIDHGWKSIGRLIFPIIWCGFFFIFLSKCYMIIKEDFDLHMIIEEGVIVKKAMRVMYEPLSMSFIF